MLIIEVIPYKTFRERLQVTKEYDGRGKIIIYDQYIYIERITGKEMEFKVKE